MIVCGSEGIPDNILIRVCADKDNRYGVLLKVAKSLRIKNTIGKECKTVCVGLGRNITENDKKRIVAFTT